jgi:hypothetical protein
VSDAADLSVSRDPANGPAVRGSQSRGARLDMGRAVSVSACGGIRMVDRLMYTTG